MIVFAKAPRFGTVKTRLARDIGGYSAWNFYRRCCYELAQNLVHGKRWIVEWRVTPDSAVRKNRFGPHRRGSQVSPQGRGDLGERMHCALFAGGARAAGWPVVLVGSDIPDIGRADMQAGFAQLRRHDIIFGPALDGGFWLVGLSPRARASKRLRFRLFQNVRWSHRCTLRDTLNSIPPGLSVGMLNTRYDVDDGEDYQLWRARTRLRSRILDTRS